MLGFALDLRILKRLEIYIPFCLCLSLPTQLKSSHSTQRNPNSTLHRQHYTTPQSPKPTSSRYQEGGIDTENTHVFFKTPIASSRVLQSTFPLPISPKRILNLATKGRTCNLEDFVGSLIGNQCERAEQMRGDLARRDGRN